MSGTHLSLLLVVPVVMTWVVLADIHQQGTMPW
jgi:hypothetical protein